MNASADARALSGFLGFLSRRRVTEAQAAEANRLRNHLLGQLQDMGARQTFYGSKLFTGELSPGCARCVADTWSCIFLTKQCTANCFFCPSSPSSNRTFPRSNRLPFSGLEDYLAFLRLFEFQGTSFSGGEPLLRLEETLNWIARLKQELGAEFYVWLYTNGDLVDEHKLRALQDAGLDEIRINIVQLVLKRVVEEPAFAQAILKDPRVALASFRLSPEEPKQVLTVVSSRYAPPPPD